MFMGVRARTNSYGETEKRIAPDVGPRPFAWVDKSTCRGHAIAAKPRSAHAVRLPVFRHDKIRDSKLLSLYCGSAYHSAQ